MSSFSSACPHCGRVNPTAPQAILRDPPPPPRPIQSRIAKPQYHSRSLWNQNEKETPSASSSNLGILEGVFHWCRELAGEWRGLGRPQKTAAQILFGLAAMTAAGFGFYVIFA